MKRKLSILYCAAILGACLFFAAGVFFSSDTASEGRDLAAPPSLTEEDGSLNLGFFADFDTWLSDHFSLRQQLITLNNAIRAGIFHTGSEQVIVGDDGYLFYTETVADYTGKSYLSDAEIDEIADALASLAAYAGEHGARFAVALAPNKNSVYGDKMPGTYPTRRSSNLRRLEAALTERGVTVADLLTPLTERAEEGLYHKKDSHWNGAGALVAYNAILDALSLSDVERFASYPLIHTRDFEGDLDAMLYPTRTLYDDNFIPDFDFTSSYRYTSMKTGHMELSLSTEGAGTYSALIFRDSFMSAMIPYFSAAFAEVRYERATPYRIDLLEDTPADIVIVEIAERNIHTLKDAAARIGG